ncbi:MAG: transporter substrate-binding domain-containing protein [Marinobacterium sp.]
MKKYLISSLLIVAGLTALLILNVQLQPSSDGWQSIRERGVLRVGFSVEAPYSYLNTNGEVMGQSPAIVEAVVKELGISKVEWVLVPFAELIPSLLERRFDMIGTSIFVTDKRQEQVLFAEPCVQVEPGMLTRTDVTEGHRRSEEDFLLRSWDRIAVLTGSVEHRELSTILPDERLFTVADVYAGRSAVMDGSVSALTLSMPTLKWLSNTAPVELTVARLPAGITQRLPAMPSAFAFHPDDTNRLPDWNRAQATVLQYPEVSSLLQELGFTPLLSRTATQEIRP